MPADNIIQFRQGTAAQWSAVNPVLSNGETGYETDTRRSKTGDGTTAWNSLTYNVLNPSGLLAGSGINISFGTNNSTATINISGLDSSYISNFSTSVSGLLPTIANSGDNRLLTSTGSSVGINAESNLVFDGARLGINTATPSGSLHVIGTGLISSLTGISPNSLLHLYSATSGDRIFNVEGTNGSLFSVDDNLSGTLMSVNNNAGLPVFEVFSDDRVVAGRFNQNDFVVTSGGNVGIGTNNPAAKLGIAGNVNVTGLLIANSGNFLNSLNINSVPVSVSGHTHTSSDITNFNSSVSGLVSGIYAPLNSPIFTGTPSVPTAITGTNTNQIASTSFVRAEISNLVAAAPSTLDTLNELASALGNDVNFSTTVTNNLAGKANLSGANFTGPISCISGSFVSGINVVNQGGGTFSMPSNSNNIFLTNTSGNVWFIGDGGGGGNVLARYQNSAAGPTMFFRKYRGSYASPTMANSGDSLGVFRFETLNFDGSSAVALSASINVVAESAPVSGQPNISSSMRFSTAQGSDSSAITRMTIRPDGNVGIGTTTPSSQLHVIGTGIFSSSDNTSIININPVGRSIDCNPSAFSDISLKVNDQNIFRGLDGWTGTWRDSASTTYFQVGRNAGNTIFTSFLGSAFTRLAYSSNKVLFTNGTSNLPIPSGYFTIGSSIDGGSVGTSGLVIDTVHSSSSANGQNHGALVVSPLFSTESSNLNTIYGAYIAPRHSGNYTTVNSYGLYVNAATNITGTITNNYAAVFNGGNVGIGTLTPSSALHVVGTGIVSSRLGIGTNSPQYSLDVSGSGNFNNVLISGIPLSEVIDDEVAGLLVAGTGINLTYDDNNNQLILSSENYYGANRGIIEVSAPASSFNIPGGYTVGGFDLFLNGVKLVNDIDFTATNGNSINTASPIPSGSVLEYISLTLANPLRIASDQYSAEISREVISVTGTLSTINIIGGYDSGGLDVYKDGLKLIKDIQYSANNGSSISLTTPATSGSVIEYVSFLAGKARRSINTITNSTTAGTIPQTDYIYVATVPNITVTMPSAVGNNNRYTIKNLSNGTINVAPTPGQTIDNQSIISILNQYISIDLVSNNQNWIII